MKARTTLVYNVLGWMFLLLGALTLLNVFVAFDMAHTMPWLGLGYGVIDLLVSYGCFTRERWIVPGFALNFAGLVALLVIAWHAQGTASFAELTVAIAAGILTAFAYERRAYLRTTSYGLVVGAGFFIIWSAAFIYTLSTILV